MRRDQGSRLADGDEDADLPVALLCSALAFNLLCTSREQHLTPNNDVIRAVCPTSMRRR